MFTYHAMSRSPIPTPVYALLCIVLSILFFTLTLNAFAEAAPTITTTHGSPAPGAIPMSTAKMSASGYCFTLVQNPNVGVWKESGGPRFEWRNGGCIPKWEDCVDAALAAMEDRAHANPDYFSGISEHGVARGCGAIAVWS